MPMRLPPVLLPERLGNTVTDRFDVVPAPAWSTGDQLVGSTSWTLDDVRAATSARSSKDCMCISRTRVAKTVMTSLPTIQ
jgi:hypothetical protein